jgi:hypothetical protein
MKNVLVVNKKNGTKGTMLLNAVETTLFLLYIIVNPQPVFLP